MLSEKSSLPQIVVDYVDLIIRKMKYSRKVRRDVRAELLSHFEDALRNVDNEQDRQKQAEELIREFGDAKLLAALIRRGKKRCRPMWRTMVVRMLQTAGVLFLLLALYIGWFFSGKPIITTNYLEVMNQTVRPTADDSQNAWPLYKQAAEKYVACGDKKIDKNPRSLSTLTHEERTILLKWVSDNENLLALVRQGNLKPYYWQIYGAGESNNNEMIALVLPNLSIYKDLSRLICWQALFSAEKSNIAAAFETTLDVYSFGQHLCGQNTTLIEQLVAMAIEGVSIVTLRTLLEENTQSIDVPLLDSVQKRFSAMVSKENSTVSFEGERLFFYDEIQRSFTQSRIGKSHLYVQRIVGFVCSSEEGRGVKVWLQLLFSHPDREQTRRSIDLVYDEISSLAMQTPASLHRQGLDIEKQCKEIAPNNILLQVITPAFGTVHKISYHSRTGSIATLTLFAIMQYYKTHSAYPDSLDVLVQSGLLEKMPLDPFSDAPLVYRKTDEGFILYSVGSNFTDDGGVPGTDKDGKPRQWGENGDKIFWPVSKE